MSQPPPPHQGAAYPHQPPPLNPSQSAYPPPMQPGFVPPPGQPGYGMPLPGQPGFGMPHPGYGAPPPGYGAPPYGMPPPTYSGPPPPGAFSPGAGYHPGGAAPYPGGGPGFPTQPGFKEKSGNDSDDSQPGDPGLRSVGGSRKIKCVFVNHADMKLKLCRIDERGKLHKVVKMKKGRKEVVETKEGDVFVARGKKRKGPLVINNNSLYQVMGEEDGAHSVKAEILRGPAELKELASEKDNEVEVKVKFINRSKTTAQLCWVNHKGKVEKVKVVAPGKCYKTQSFEGHSWIAHDVKSQDDNLYLNYSHYYSPWKTRRRHERVLITQDRPWGSSSGSSSSGDSD